MLDLISSVALTAEAAVLIAVLVTAFGATPRGRATIYSTLGTWFMLVMVAGATNLFDAVHGVGIGGFSLAVAAPVAVLATLALRTEAGRARIAATPLPGLVGSQITRVVGVCFLLLYAAHRLPAPFAPVAGWGDIAVGALAPLVALMAARSPASARTAILAWNTLGLLDLVAAVVLGTASAPSPIQVFTTAPGTQVMTSLPWIFIPCFLVPVNALVHFMIFAKMKAERAVQRDALALS